MLLLAVLAIAATAWLSPSALSARSAVSAESSTFVAAYTVAGVGPYAALGLTVLNEDLTLPASGKSRVRVINGSARAQTVSVTAQDGPAVADVVALAKTTPSARA